MIEIFKKRWVYHSVIWVLIYLVFFLDGGEHNDATLPSALVRPLMELFPLVFITYSGFWAKSKFFNHRKYGFYIAALIGINIVALVIFESLRRIGYYQDNPLLQNWLNIVFVLLITIGLQYFKRGIISQYQLQELRAKTAETELNALKAQINPHFLFNTLNNIYGMNQIDSVKGSDMILELADVMRYHLEFSKVGTIRLEDEVQLIRSYIKLEELRLTDNCDLKVEIRKTDLSLRISPLLFLPFVENAFKHGTHPLQPCYIHIKLDTSDRMINFEIINSMIENRKVVKTHVGLENTVRRLELIYPNNHEITVDSTADYYKVSLKINV